MELHHLSRIVSLYPNKAVSRFATFKIRKSLLEQGLATDDEIVSSLLICKKCSQKFIPGKNCQVSIEGPRKQYRNCVCYKCNDCNVKTRFNGIPKKFDLYNIKPKAKLEVEHQETVKKNEKDDKKESIIKAYTQPAFRSLNKQEKKKSLLESFFESTNDKNLYKVFH
ncbi:hypothetical protein SteCoe_10273 [Stentor coeruleus]|uniref:RNAse P Rpr2/Rpp21 subunit domain-containing protein n=1 Tax=Stentor coeruleus TaxID=5963 RepID=A0A1R2CFY7_9CILI|nr:hypothetical protein SteCoe_10273 [Stentor coeruleus]